MTNYAQSIIAAHQADFYSEDDTVLKGSLFNGTHYVKPDLCYTAKKQTVHVYCDNGINWPI